MNEKIITATTLFFLQCILQVIDNYFFNSTFEWERVKLDAAVNEQKINTEYLIYHSLSYFTKIFNSECLLRIKLMSVAYMNKMIIYLISMIS